MLCESCFYNGYMVWGIKLMLLTHSKPALYNSFQTACSTKIIFSFILFIETSWWNHLNFRTMFRSRFSFNISSCSVRKDCIFFDFLREFFQFLILIFCPSFNLPGSLWATFGNDENQESTGGTLLLLLLLLWLLSSLMFLSWYYCLE